MNILAYFILAFAVFLVVGAQKGNKRAQETFQVIEKICQENQDASVFDNATFILKNGYTKGTNIISSSENNLMEGISSAEKLFNKDPEAAKKIIRQAFDESKIDIFMSARDYFQSLGGALALSNNGAKQGLGDASQLLQRAGFALLDVWNIGKKLIEQGLDAGGDASKVLFISIRLTVESGFSVCYDNIQKSIKTANQALRDAQKTPIQERYENQSCDAPAEDLEYSKALEEINEAAINALKNGADAKLVQKFQEVIICQLGEIVKVAAKSKQVMQYIRTIIETDPENAKKTYAKEREAVKNVSHNTTANIHLLIGDIALKSDNELRDEIGLAILALDMSKAEMFLSLDTAAELLEIGSNYQGDAPLLAVDVASRNGYYAKLTYIQGIRKAAKLFLSMF